MNTIINGEDEPFSLCPYRNAYAYPIAKQKLIWHPRNKAQDVPLFADLPPTPPDRKLLRADSATMVDN